MLFADLAGYTRYCDERDPEDVHLLVRPLMNALRAICEELGGLVPVIEGDGFMAVFGAAQTREDDPRRAVLAAARLQELVTARRSAAPDAVPSLRVGVHVGEVLVAPSWEATGLSVSGDVVNLTSRLCKAAEEGEVLASAALIACVPVDAWGEPREISLAGISAVQVASPLLWDRLEEPAVVLRGESQTPYVARPELDQVLDVVRTGEPLLVVGEPGMGKSRLLTELGRRLGADAVRIRFSELGADTEPFAPLAAALLTSAAEHVTEVVVRRVRRLSGAALDTDEPDSRDDQLAALQELVGRTAPGRLVLLLDDVDAAAGRDADVVRTWVQPDGSGPVVVATSRRSGALPVAELSLPPLDASQVAALVHRLLPGAPEELVQHLLDRSGGVPLFVEQYVRLLVEDGTVEVDDAGCAVVAPDRLSALPTAMRLFVASRLDVLDPGTRRVVAAASVAGPAVDPDLLAHLTGHPDGLAEQVETLVERGFLEWEQQDGRALLRFRHQVLRDVAYDGLLKRDRIATHRVAAEWYAVLPVLHMLSEEARHLEAAIALGDGDCDAVRRAVEVLGRLAAGIVDENPVEARAVVARAESLAADHPRCEADLLEAQAAAARSLLHQGQEPEAEALAVSVADQAAERGDAELEAGARLTAGRAIVLRDPVRAEAQLRRAEELFGLLGDAGGLSRVETARAEGTVPLKDRLAAWERAYRAAMRGAERRLASLAAQDLAMHASVRDPGEAERWSEAAEALRRADDVVGVARLEVASGLTALMRLEYDTAAVHAAAGAAQARASGQRQLHMNAELFALEAEVLSGRLDEADRRVTELLALAETRPTRHLRTDTLTCAALLRSRQGRGAEAAQLLAELEGEAAELGETYVAQWHAFSARVALERGDHAAAAQHADEAAVRELELDMPSWALRERVVAVVSRLASGAAVPLSELSQVRSQARLFGAGRVVAELARWTELVDRLHDMAAHDPDLPESPGTPEARALDLEIAALSHREWDRLLEAAEVWAELGTTVWQARALLWHTELAGTEHDEAGRLLEVLQSPAGLAERLRRQVRGLKG